MPAYTKNTPGQPTSGLYTVADTVTDSTGVVWECIQSGQPGKWIGARKSQAVNEGTPASYATAGAQTYTAADVLSGIIVRDCAGASRTDVLPTAALLEGAMTAPQVGDIVRCRIINGSDPTTEVLTINNGSGGGFDANQTAVSRIIAGGNSKDILIRLTNVTAGAEAYVVYM
jgi:hypothetical protein